MSVPTVSVIMAVYNGAAFLPETLASLRAQTLTGWELVAVDDCSRDNSVAVLEAQDDPRIRVIRSDANGGPVVARNRAFAEARGRYVAGLDQDDISVPHRFARQVAFLDAHPDVVLVSSAADHLINGRREPGNWPRPLSPVLIDWLLLLHNPIAWSSVMFRANAARQLDPFERPDMRYVEDYDLYHRIRGYGRLAQIDEVLMLYRRHAGGASQMFDATMHAHAEKLLHERHRAILGGETPAVAPLLVRHVIDGDPVPDTATLDAIFAGIAALRTAFGRGASSAAELDEVDRSVAQLWWKLYRAGVRSGRLTLHRTVRSRPFPVPPGMARDLVINQLIGGVRAVRRKFTGARGA